MKQTKPKLKEENDIYIYIYTSNMPMRCMT